MQPKTGASKAVASAGAERDGSARDGEVVISGSRLDNEEREAKFAVRPSFVMPDLGSVVAGVHPLSKQQLRTAYFDTIDMRLWQRGITLRHRTGESAPTGSWTLKLPSTASGFTLDRSELSWVAAGDAVPPDAVRLLRGIARRSSIGQVVTLETTRRRLVLRDVAGAACAELSDDTVVVVGGPRDGHVFRQLEIELGSGGERVLDAVSTELRRAGARRVNDAKLANALGLGASPARRGAQRAANRSLRAVVEMTIADGLDRLLDRDYRLRLEPSNPDVEDVHQARVATRRLRSDLKTFAPVLDPVWIVHVREELGWIGEAFGRLRDVDVLTGALAQRGRCPLDAEDGKRELLAVLNDERASAYAALVEVLDDHRYIDTLDRLHAASLSPPFYAHSRAVGGRSKADPNGPARRVLPRLVDTQRRALRRKVRAAGRNPSDRELHRIRIKAKQLRYAAEAAAPVIGQPARRTARAAEALQNVLGEHHDAIEAERWLRGAASGAPGPAGYLAGWLAAEQRQRQVMLRGKWRRRWHEVERKTCRKWLEP